MIQMLSAFNLSRGTNLSAFSKTYDSFVASLRDDGLVEASSRVGTRVADTPMDTDDQNQRRYFTLMTFRDRAQLDAAYDRIANDMTAHLALHQYVADGQFTCWDLNHDI